MFSSLLPPQCRTKERDPGPAGPGDSGAGWGQSSQLCVRPGLRPLSTSGCARGQLLDPAEIEFSHDPAPLKLRSTERGLLGSSLESSTEGSPGPCQTRPQSQRRPAGGDASSVGDGTREETGPRPVRVPWPLSTVPARLGRASAPWAQARVPGTERGLCRNQKLGSGCRRAGGRWELQETRAQLLHPLDRAGGWGPRSSRPLTPGGAQGCLSPLGHLETGDGF